MRRQMIFALLLAAGFSTAAAEEPAVTDKDLRAAVEKALPLILKGAVGHREQRTCFACHNQGIPILATMTAKSRGFAVDDAEISRQMEFISKFLAGNKENYLQGKGQGGNADTAGYALVTLEAGGWKADETTAAVTEFLLLYQKDEDHWRANSSRPPSENSPFTTSYVSLRGLAAFSTPEQKERTGARTEKVREWLLKAPVKENEDRVFRLFALKQVAADEKEIAAAKDELIKTQQEGGGWRQLDSLESDAYATGTALVALHQAGGLATSDPAYQRGLAWLLKTQLSDGSWHVHSRSKPFQKYFETGFPHEKDQFISSAATSWAVMALALACEAK